MTYPLCLLLLASALGVSAPLSALAQETTPSVEPDPVKPGTPVRHAYLSEPLSDTDLITGPPPISGSAAFAADLVAYWSTRGLKGSSRWALATKDGARGAAVMLDDFTCALGRRLDPATVPRLMTLFDHVQPPRTSTMTRRSALNVTLVSQTRSLIRRATRPWAGHWR